MELKAQYGFSSVTREDGQKIITVTGQLSEEDAEQACSASSSDNCPVTVIIFCPSSLVTDENPYCAFNSTISDKLP